MRVERRGEGGRVNPLPDSVQVHLDLFGAQPESFCMTTDRLPATFNPSSSSAGNLLRIVRLLSLLLQVLLRSRNSLLLLPRSWFEAFRPTDDVMWLWSLRRQGAEERHGAGQSGRGESPGTPNQHTSSYTTPTNILICGVGVLELLPLQATLSPPLPLSSPSALSFPPPLPSTSQLPFSRRRVSTGQQRGGGGAGGAACVVEEATVRAVREQDGQPEEEAEVVRAARLLAYATPSDP